ncbi:MAG: DedA family protein [Gemmatimonadetes bacterium]|nr:DedA family protein [Gemmatimonadota bacterium]
MEGLLEHILELLIAAGPWIVFAVAATETAFFIGLAIPAEATVLLAAFLAERGMFPVEQVLAGAFFGGLTGDQTGYLLGRHGGRRMAARGGWFGRLWGRYEGSAADLFRRRSAVAVTLARFTAFVRTLMPWFAGMSRMPYPRFLFYDLLGVLGWAGGSVLLGYAAGESWDAVARALGAASAIVIALLVLVAFVLWWRRRRPLAP